VKQVLVNLLSIAVKFTELGYIRLSCKLASREKSRLEVIFQVDDSGIGIKESRLETIFEMFEQAESGVFGRYGGSGLGLGLVKGLVALMGGKVGVRSDVGKGSSFWVTLPLESCAVANAPREKDPQTVPDWSKRHVLIVDDVEMNLMVLEGILELTGCRISKAHDGQEALARLQSTEGIDLVLMDIHMPELDGLVATKQIRAMESEFRDVKIVAVTGAAMEEDRKNALEAGMNGVLFKPLEPTKIFEL
ncbi:MAG: response regulator, partial [Limnobacter sp.]|nr:response regulator [Limnobacter sp.]